MELALVRMARRAAGGGGQSGSEGARRAGQPAGQPGGRAARGEGPNRFSRTRAAHADEIDHDYLEAIDQLVRTAGQARVTDLAVLMDVSHVTVTRRVARLQRAGLVSTEPYKPVVLTAAGERRARASRARHETVLAFLIALGVPAGQAEVDAEGIEHHASDETVAAMRAYLDRSRAGGGAVLDERAGPEVRA